MLNDPPWGKAIKTTIITDKMNSTVKAKRLSIEAPQPHRKLVCMCDDGGAPEDVNVDELEVRFDSGGCAHGRSAATSVAVGEVGGGCWRATSGYVTVSRSLHGRPDASRLEVDGDGGDTSPRLLPNASDWTPSRRAVAQYGAAHAFVPIRSKIAEPLPN